MKTEQLKNNYSKQIILFNDALETYRKKQKITENLEATRKEIENRIADNESLWAKEIDEANGCLTADADKSAFMVATAKEQLEKIIAMQKKAGLALLEAASDLNNKSRELMIVHRELCHHVISADVAALKAKVIDAVILLAAVNALGEKPEHPSDLKSEIADALNKGEKNRNIANDYILSARENGNDRLSLFPDPLPEIAYTISKKCPSPSQLLRAKGDTAYLDRLISGREPLRGSF
ncbi:TPA: hypothetical protein ACHGD4_000012 [Escherichia coli]|nr:hypothetical protein [Escherichia coli O146]